MTFSLRVERAANEANAVVTIITTAAAAWLAPIPEAAMTSRAIAHVFELPVGLAWATALAIEAVGVAVNTQWQEAREFNAALDRHRERYGGKTDRETRAPDGMWPVAAFYTATTAIVWGMAIYEAVTYGDPLRLLACLFPIVSAIGIVTTNRRAALYLRVAQRDADAQQDAQVKRNPPAQSQQATAKIAIEPQLAQQASAEPQPESQLSAIETAIRNTSDVEAVADRRVELWQLRKAQPSATQAQLARVVGVSASTVRNDLSAIDAALV